MPSTATLWKMEAIIPVSGGIAFTKNYCIDNDTDNVFVIQQEADLTDASGTVDALQTAILEAGYDVSNLPDL